MHALENRVLDPASQPPPRLLVSKDYQQMLYDWRIVCLEENGVDSVINGGVVSNIKIIRVPCVLYSILYIGQETEYLCGLNACT